MRPLQRQNTAGSIKIRLPRLNNVRVLTEVVISWEVLGNTAVEKTEIYLWGTRLTPVRLMYGKKLAK